jgi:hypothetical protein
LTPPPLPAAVLVFVAPPLAVLELCDPVSAVVAPVAPPPLVVELAAAMFEVKSPLVELVTALDVLPPLDKVLFCALFVLPSFVWGLLQAKATAERIKLARGASFPAKRAARPEPLRYRVVLHMVYKSIQGVRIGRKSAGKAPRLLGISWGTEYSWKRFLN